MGFFRILEEHDDAPHEYHILVPAHDDWLRDLARMYRALRTHTDLPLSGVRLDGVTVLSPEALRRRLTRAAVPRRRGGNFDVLRSDLGEMALAVHGEETYGYQYGYRSVRDRELVSLPGRGIDQIAVTTTDERSGLVLVLGEAKVSSERKSPPSVVDASNDCLRRQHLDHMADLSATADKVLNAARRCTDPDTSDLLFLAADALYDGNFDRVTVYCHSFVVRPASAAAASDYGSFKSEPTSYSPGIVRFTILRLPDDNLEAIVNQFGSIARGDADDEFEAQEDI